jgi:hypothetical protein
MSLKKELWIAGFSSFFGGADTELDHLTDLWRMYDVEVHFVPMFGCDPKMKALVLNRGCYVHDYKPDIFKDKIVGSWCNGEFLKHLPDIMEQGRPKCIIWHNTMTWTFPLEKVAHKNGWIDYFGFVSEYQKSWLKPELEKIAPVRELEGYRPYFNLDNPGQNLKFSYKAPENYFAMGRISRDDGNKYSSDMWQIFNKVLSPKPKKTYILGYGENAHKKCGKAPPELDWQIWPPNGIPVKEFYKILHCVIHKTGGSRESYCRIVPECYAAGVPIIAEDDYAFPTLIIDGVTGYRCKSSDEMSYRASELAFDEEKRKNMVFAARDFLVNEISNKDKCWQPWEKLFKEYGMN